MYQKFEDLIRDLSRARPTQKSGDETVFFYNDQPVVLKPGEMEDLHWVDIHIELRRFQIDSVQTAHKVLKANLEMGSATPIPTWFAVNEANRVVFINRLDWRHLTVKILDDHVLRCVEQMSEALMTEGV